MIHIIDGRVGGYYVLEQLRNAGLDGQMHVPRELVGRSYYHPSSLSVDHSIQEIEQHITDVLSKYRGTFLISSFTASLVANQMLDLCGQSNNVITCASLDESKSWPVIATSISVNLYKTQRQKALITGRLKKFGRGPEFVEADAAVKFIDNEVAWRAQARAILNDEPKFLSSPSLIVAADLLRSKGNSFHNYAGIVKGVTTLRTSS